MANISKLVNKVQEIPDFRSPRGQRYRLYNLLSISILAVIAGADDFEAISEFAKMRAEFLKRHRLLDGVRFPSHDVFRWIFLNLDKTSFAKLLSFWLEESINNHQINKKSMKVELDSKMIHIDGKSICATRSSEHTRTALQIVSAYCSDFEFCLGQLIIDKKSCEKTAIPMLLDLLDLKNTIITIDAIATSKKNASKIVEKGGDYILALKKNNRHFFTEVESFFNNFIGSSLIIDLAQTHDKKHGRTEIRKCHIISDLKYFPDAIGWKDLKSLVCVESQRTQGDKTTMTKKYFLTSLDPNAKILLASIRKHWTVENNLHWCLDVAFNEDKSRLKNKQAAANFAAIRRFSLGLIKNAKISKHSIKTQRLKAAWNNEFLEQLFQIFY